MMDGLLCCLESCQLPSSGIHFGHRDQNRPCGGKSGRLEELYKQPLEMVQVALLISLWNPHLNTKLENHFVEFMAKNEWSPSGAPHIFTALLFHMVLHRVVITSFKFFQVTFVSLHLETLGSILSYRSHLLYETDGHTQIETSPIWVGEDHLDSQSLKWCVFLLL